MFKFTWATLLALLMTLCCAALWICGYVTEELNDAAMNMLVLFFFGLLGVTALTTLPEDKF